MRPSVVIVRHAEKEIGGKAPFGVTVDGVRDPESLTPRGWQRAGALVGLFVPPPMNPALQRFPAPTHLFASRVGSDDADSRRPLETLVPLSERLGIEVDDRYFRGQLDEVRTAILACDGVVLVAWEHKMIPGLAAAITGDPDAVPAAWPDDRFDMCWFLEADEAAGRYGMRQVPQSLLAGDQDHPI